MKDSDASTPSQSSWLAEYLAEAIVSRTCVRPYCTTCGAMEFRRGLYDRAGNAIGRPIESQRSHEIMTELVTQLAALKPSVEGQHRWFDAVRLVFCEVWDSVGESTAECEYQPILEDTWAGSVLLRMQDHHARRMSVIREQELATFPEVVQKRREEKRRRRQERHAERLAAKRERDQLWFKRHPRTDS